MEETEGEHYVDLVADSQQVNIPPGGRNTIKQWIREGFVSDSSNVLEMGCNTGYISYHLSNYTGADVTGTDLSPETIEAAKRYTEGDDRTTFRVGDAADLEFPRDSFSHVVIGGHLPWVPSSRRPEHLAEAKRLVEADGFLLVALYYYETRPPESFVEQFNDEFDTQLDPDHDYDYWSSLFDDPTLSPEYEANFEVSAPSEDRKSRYIEGNIGTMEDEWETKIELLSENAQYVNFFVKVIRKVGNEHYREFPPGGIYQWEETD